MNKTEALEKIEEMTKDFESNLKSLKEEFNQVNDVEEKINKGLEVKLEEEVKKLSCLFQISKLYKTLGLKENSNCRGIKIYLKCSHTTEEHYVDVYVRYDHIALHYWNTCYFTIYEDSIDNNYERRDVSAGNYGDILQMIPYWYETAVDALNKAMKEKLTNWKKQLENLKKDVTAMSEYVHIEETEEDDHWNDYLMYLVGWISDNKDNVGDSPVTYEDYVKQF